MYDKGNRYHKLFFLAAFVWIFSYMSIYLALCNPLNSTFIKNTSDLLFSISIILAIVSMVFALFWGLKELQRDNSTRSICSEMQYEGKLIPPKPQHKNDDHMSLLTL